MVTIVVIQLCCSRHNSDSIWERLPLRNHDSLYGNPNSLYGNPSNLYRNPDSLSGNPESHYGNPDSQWQPWVNGNPDTLLDDTVLAEGAWSGIEINWNRSRMLACTQPNSHTVTKVVRQSDINTATLSTAKQSHSPTVKHEVTYAQIHVEQSHGHTVIL